MHFIKSVKSTSRRPIIRLKDDREEKQTDDDDDDDDNNNNNNNTNICKAHIVSIRAESDDDGRLFHKLTTKKLLRTLLVGLSHNV